eukprot:6731472-Pyramimonas_sp.AAC.1
MCGTFADATHAYADVTLHDDARGMPDDLDDYEADCQSPEAQVLISTEADHTGDAALSALYKRHVWQGP